MHDKKEGFGKGLNMHIRSQSVIRVEAVIFLLPKNVKFQTCLQNVSKAVWDYCCVRWQLVLKVIRYEIYIYRYQFDHARRNQ